MQQVKASVGENYALAVTLQPSYPLNRLFQRHYLFNAHSLNLVNVNLQLNSSTALAGQNDNG
jgi:hypothetical protein